MNLEKLKDSARKFEQKEDWRKAIDVYLKAIQQIESGAESSPDLSLYNRVGDLYLKINDIPSAVRSYERAVDLYADQGFFNNAIALCGKILRVNPGRTQTYLKLAQLHARKNVVIEAKRNLIEFLERMNALGQLDPAFQSVKEFADQFSGSQEIRIMLVELLRASSREEEAQEQLRKLAGDIEARGDRPFPRGPSGAEAATETVREERPEPPPPMPVSRGGLVFLDTGVDVGSTPSRLDIPAHPDLVQPLADIDEPVTPVTVHGLEQTNVVDFESASEEAMPPLELEGVVEDDLSVELTEGLTINDVPVESIEDLDVPADLDAPEGLDVSDELDASLAELEGDAPMATDGLPMIETDSSSDLIELENRVLDDPENPELHRALAEHLLAQDDLMRGIEELDLALMGYERFEDWPAASDVADRLVEVDSEGIRHHQKRVELAFRMGDRGPLLVAYLALGDALARAGATDKASAVFRRVQEHDPGNPHAALALASLSAEEEVLERGAHPRTIASPVRPAGVPAPTPEPPKTEAPPQTPPPSPAAPRSKDDSFLDLGSLIFEEAGPRDTRMRIDRREPQDEDEQREFQEILEQFKRGIDENLESDDYQAHYDLGVAFKEMGLLDEAIAEFQKALRAPEGRLRTSEALGIAFFDKGQFTVSETVLRRAVETDHEGDEAKIGLLYWLGRACEAQGKDDEAIASYERAMAVDIRFMDLGGRVQRLSAGRRE
ncbi:MAG TPA: tetratricopeptide repeat protein [Gemmatimonadales bacterium]|jgi:tetratricopeptide (TPR) repeat protein